MSSSKIRFRKMLHLVVSLTFIVAFLVNALQLSPGVVQAASVNSSSNTAAKQHPILPPPPAPTPQPLVPPAADQRSVPAFVDPHLPALAIQIDVTPKAVALGEAVTVTITVSDEANDPASDLVVTLPTPKGVQPLPGLGYLSATQGWSWTSANLKEHASATFTATMRLTSLPTGEALIVQAQATAKGLGQAAQATGGALIDRALGPATTNFNPGSSATLKSNDGRVEVKLPADVAKGQLKLQHIPFRDKLPDLKASGATIPPEVAGYHRGFESFFLEAHDLQGNEVHKFDKPVTISVHYTPEQLLALGRSEADLTLFWFDEAKTVTLRDGTTKQGDWVALQTEVDMTSHTASAVVNHFSNYALSDASSPSTAFLPSLQGWQENLFIGAATYQYPIDVPAGPNGIKPQLAFTYNSAATDGKSGQRQLEQAGWVGKGWDLDTGSIGLVKVGKTYQFYTMVFNGQSFDLVQGEPLVANAYTYSPWLWAWRTTNESFTKVRYVQNGNTGDDRGLRGKWQVWSKDCQLPGYNDIGVSFSLSDIVPT